MADFTQDNSDYDIITVLANKVAGQATSLKVDFDEAGKLQQTYNNDVLVTELNSDGTSITSGAERLGSKAIAGVDGTNVHDQLTDLKAQINTKSDASGVVDITSIQTITGAKTFEDITVPVLPVDNTDPASKKYADDLALAGIGDGSLTNDKLSTAIKIGDVADLVTSSNTNIVGAINEVDSHADNNASNLTSHIGSTGTTHGAATTSVNGFMSSTDKTKLDGVATGATKVVITVSTSDASGGNDGDIWIKREA